MKKRRKYLVIVLLLLVATFGIVFFCHRNTKKISYTEAISYIQDGKVAKLTVNSQNGKAKIELKDGSVCSTNVSSADEISSLVTEQLEKGNYIEYNIRNLKFIIKIALFIVLIIFISIVVSASANFGNMKIEQYHSDLTFEDVAGIDEERYELEEIVEFLQNPKKFEKIGAKIPKGVLLYGKPGTGKTLLAKAIAGEAKVPFFAVNGSSFDEIYVGVGALRIRSLFEKARKASPCIIFIDEIDSVAKERYREHNYSEQTLNQLLEEMDGIDSSEDNIIIIAATNNYEVLDPAITRPGRFDRHIYVPMPDENARKEILKIHSKNKKLAEDVSLEEIAKKTTGLTGADLSNILNESAILAARGEKEYIGNEEINESIVKVMLGVQKKNISIDEDTKKAIAIHEAGHAVLARIAANEQVLEISIIPRGTSGGYTLINEKDEILVEKQQLINKIKEILGGRAAEKVMLGEISTGAADDLQRATELAYKMINNYAMGHSKLVCINGNEAFNDKLSEITIKDVNKVVAEANDEAFKSLQQRKDVLTELSNRLMQKQYLAREEIEEIFSNYGI